MSTAIRTQKAKERKARVSLTNLEAWKVIGGLGKPSKMPGYAYGISAFRCITGGKLHLIEGTPCYHCYALKGRYIFANVRACHERRYQSLKNPRWVEAMVQVIRWKCRKVPFFRWFDSGDLQGVWHLLLIMAVAWCLPDVHFWLPTQERGFVRMAQLMGFDFPPNLVIRLSATKIDLQEELESLGLPMSSVRSFRRKVPKGQRPCPAPQQEHKCDACRACWDKRVKWVGYAEI